MGRMLECPASSRIAALRRRRGRRALASWEGIPTKSVCERGFSHQDARLYRSPLGMKNWADCRDRAQRSAVFSEKRLGPVERGGHRDSRSIGKSWAMRTLWEL